MDGYREIIVKPTIPASSQNSAAYSVNDVLFDWTAFTVSHGFGRMIGTNILIRGTDGVRQEQPFDLYYHQGGSAPTLGPNNNPVNMPPSNGFLGGVHVSASHYMDGLPTMEFANNITSARLTIPKPIILQLKSALFKYINIGAVAQGAFDFRSGVTCTGVQPTTQNILTVGGTSALINFAPGDVLHDENSRLLGTVRSVDSATQMTMVDNLANATVNGDKVYNINPITITLSFSYNP